MTDLVPKLRVLNKPSHGDPNPCLTAQVLRNNAVGLLPDDYRDFGDWLMALAEKPAAGEAARQLQSLRHRRLCRFHVAVSPAIPAENSTPF